MLRKLMEAAGIEFKRDRADENSEPDSRSQLSAILINQGYTRVWVRPAAQAFFSSVLRASGTVTGQTYSSYAKLAADEATGFFLSVVSTTGSADGDLLLVGQSLTREQIEKGEVPPAVASIKLVDFLKTVGNTPVEVFFQNLPRLSLARQVASPAAGGPAQA